MEYTKLGNSELNVSRICLGCMGFGDAAEGGHTWAVDEKSSNAIIKRALELGVNFLILPQVTRMAQVNSIRERLWENLQNVMKSLSLQSFSPEARKKSKMVSVANSISINCWTEALKILEWTILTCIFVICGTIIRRLKKLWKL